MIGTLCEALDAGGLPWQAERSARQSRNKRPPYASRHSSAIGGPAPAASRRRVERIGVLRVLRVLCVDRQ